MVPPPELPSRMAAAPKGSMAFAPTMNTSSGPILTSTFGSSEVFIPVTFPFSMTWWLYRPLGSVRQQPFAVTTPPVNMPLSSIPLPRSSSNTYAVVVLVATMIVPFFRAFWTISIWATARPISLFPSEGVSAACKRSSIPPSSEIVGRRHE